jgi:hypothetical protein
MTPQDPETLLPCPFCGGAPELKRQEDGPLYAVVCGNAPCDKSGMLIALADRGQGLTKAIAAWNTRTGRLNTATAREGHGPAVEALYELGDSSSLDCAQRNRLEMIVLKGIKGAIEDENPRLFATSLEIAEEVFDLIKHDEGCLASMNRHAAAKTVEVIIERYMSSLTAKPAPGPDTVRMMVEDIRERLKLIRCQNEGCGGNLTYGEIVTAMQRECDAALGALAQYEADMKTAQEREG